ncbi:two-component sensor histidine kinase [Bacillus cereus]|uniref:HAMP domain-containing sensor histidine kinase n=1 Tax=Bacillus cereus TaxID=1396 RepID=UPI0009958EF9|nr:HAMP domain-containing sensor histidine kinase [Bacillus cereus]OPA24261.1 two-component sensor histidine kinase [Bacillus cereus]
MHRKIVFQLFSLTFLLCCIIIAIIFIGQFFVIQYLYVDKEKEVIQTQLQKYYKSYQTYTKDEKFLQGIEASIFKEKGIMIARLDADANIKVLPSGDYYIKVVNKNDSNSTSKVVFNNLINAKKDVDYNFGIIVTSLINQLYKVVVFEAISKDKNKDIVVPTTMRVKGYEGSFVAQTYHQVLKNIMADDKSARKFFTKDENNNFFNLEGIVEEVHFPNYNKPEADNTLYSNEIFANRILEFQSSWITDKVKLKEEKWTQNEISINGIKYIETIKPIMKDGKVIELIYSLTSLQPITKVTDFMKDYYVYIVIVVLILSFIFCISYSKIITKPLLKVNLATKRIMEFKFGEKLDIKSKNEIGELSQNIDRLSERMERYIRKLEEDIEKERKLENTRKDFIAGVSHELKTPLSVMQISASMLQDGLAPEKNEYYWNAIENEIEKMNIIIKEMLNLAKYESGTYEMKIEEVDITQLTKSICDKLKLQVEKKELNVIMHLEQAICRGSASLLEQVITNLFINAIWYTDPQQSIIVDVKEIQGSVYVGIENKGAYLSEDHLEKIWDQFYRVDSSRNRENSGTGLGLPIVKKILDLHEANYGANNTEEGVLFYFYLSKTK